MADGLDPVAVGVAQEGAVIGRVIMAQAGRTVVAAPGGDAGIPERIDLGPRLRLETPVPAEGVIGFGALADREVDAFRKSGACPFAIAQPVIAAADLDDLKRFHDRVVEGFGRGDIRYGDGNMVEHDLPVTRRS